MKTRRFEKRKPNDIVRYCKHCRITNDDIPFLVQKSSKNGKFYINSLCRPCYDATKSLRRMKYYLENREKEIKKAKEWNVENRERYNKNRRKTFLEKWCG